MVERLVHVTEERTAGEDVLARLRALHPRAELVYAGEGLWYFGLVGDHQIRRAAGEKMLARESAKPVAFRRARNELFGRLLCQGFQFVCLWHGTNPADFVPTAEFYTHQMQRSEKEMDRIFEELVTADEVQEQRQREALAEHIHEVAPGIIRLVKRGGPRPFFGPLARRSR